jgi:hypothetical protein
MKANPAMLVEIDTAPPPQIHHGNNNIIVVGVTNSGLLRRMTTDRNPAGEKARRRNGIK